MIFDGSSSDRLIEAVIAHIESRGEISSLNIARGRSAALEEGDRLDRVLTKLGLICDEQIASAWSATTGLTLIDAQGYPEKRIDLDGVAPQFFLGARVLPIEISDAGLSVAVADPTNEFAIRALALKTGRSIKTVLAPAGELQNRIARLYQSANEDEETIESLDALTTDIERLRDIASDAPVIRSVSEIIDAAIEFRASDIHLDAMETGTRMRFRIDGVLHERKIQTRVLHAALISRLKIIAGLDIAERRLPQDGRIRMGWRGRTIDLRIATSPSLFGEGAVLRVLDRNAVRPHLDELGFQSSTIAALKTILAEPHGIFLVTGPTGSGKTTTLYAALEHVTRPYRNIITIEDPVEYQLDGINQIQVNKKIGLDFSSALRSALRSDPDVIMVGEIRDSETASMAVRAALTGHLVLATLHTNSSCAAVPRLIDMGVEPYLLASTLRGVLAQRLARRMCPQCKGVAAHERRGPGAGDRPGASGDPGDALESSPARGCAACDDAGYKGRVAVGEMLLITSALRELVSKCPTESALEKAAIDEEALVSLASDAHAKLGTGLTSADEIKRILGAL